MSVSNSLTRIHLKGSPADDRIDDEQEGVFGIHRSDRLAGLYAEVVELSPIKRRLFIRHPTAMDAEGSDTYLFLSIGNLDM